MAEVVPPWQIAGLPLAELKMAAAVLPLAGLTVGFRPLTILSAAVPPLVDIGLAVVHRFGCSC